MTLTCRYCAAPLTLEMADLGETPLANSYLDPSEEAKRIERSFPLRVMVCNICRLVQTTETVPEDAIFDHDYAYLSSFSRSWLDHAARYCREMTARFGLDASSKVVEIASNDGYLLKNFVEMKIPVLGVEPAGHAAEIAREKGVETQVAFFGRDTARRLLTDGHAADLMAANNVLAHVPDIDDFMGGFKVLLKPEGVATFEFPHLANLIRHMQFDTIYHEHYSYLSLLFIERLVAGCGLEVFDVERLATHGGSLRVFVGHEGVHEPKPSVDDVREEEIAMVLHGDDVYARFGPQVERLCSDLRDFVETAQTGGKTVTAYGAPAKGNTFLNVAGITNEHIAFTVDRNPEKQGKLLPGSRIPVLPVDEIARRKPDYLLILPWNLREEIMGEQAQIRDWGAKFVTAVPELDIA